MRSKTGELGMFAGAISSAVPSANDVAFVDEDHAVGNE